MTKFVHHDLGHLSGGEVVEVTLSGNSANVRLMNTSDFSRYRSGKSHHYIGGLSKSSPIRLKVPHSGHWHIAVDLLGLRGRVRSSARILPRPLPTLRPLAQDGLSSSLIGLLPSSAVRDIQDSVEETFDDFISHAWEDKDEVVRPLARALRDEGLDVWYDEFALRIGDSLRRSIDKGLAASRFGFVVLSEHFFDKKWPNYELDGIVIKAGTDDQIILPVWHNIGREEVVVYSPSLADKVARNTSDFSVEQIASEIAELIRERIGRAATRSGVPGIV